MDPRVFGRMFVEKDDLPKLVIGEDLNNDLIKGRMKSVERLADDVNMRGTRDIYDEREG